MDVDKIGNRASKVSKRKQIGTETKQQKKKRQEDKSLQHTTDLLCNKLHPEPPIVVNPGFEEIAQIFELHWNFTIELMKQVEVDYSTLLSINREKRKIIIQAPENVSFHLIGSSQKYNYILFNILEKKTVLILYHMDNLYISNIDVSSNIISLNALHNVFPITRLNEMKYQKGSGRLYYEANQPLYIKLNKKYGKYGSMPKVLQHKGQTWYAYQGEWISYVVSIFKPFEENKAIILDTNKKVHW